MSDEEKKPFTIPVEQEEQLTQDFYKAGFRTDEDREELLAGFKWYLEHEEPIVPLNIFNERVSICRECDIYRPALGKSGSRRSICKECGCGPSKMIGPSQKCPLNPPKWGAIKYLK